MRLTSFKASWPEIGTQLRHHTTEPAACIASSWAWGSPTGEVEARPGLGRFLPGAFRVRSISDVIAGRIPGRGLIRAGLRRCERRFALIRNLRRGRLLRRRKGIVRRIERRAVLLRLAQLGDLLLHRLGEEIALVRKPMVALELPESRPRRLAPLSINFALVVAEVSQATLRAGDCRDLLG
jgi:hypothetical protein